MKRIKQPRIPTIVAMILLLTGIVMAIGFYWHNYSINRQLWRYFQPDEDSIKVVNLTENSALISWQTTNKTASVVRWGETKELTEEAIDLRDKTATTSAEYWVHAVVLKNLQPSTTYNFKIQSGPMQFPNQPITFQTGPRFETRNPFATASASLVKSTLALTASLYKPIMGSIQNPNHEPVDEALIYLEVPGAAPLGSVTTKAGNFIIPVALARTANLQSQLPISDGLAVNLVAQKGALSSIVKIRLPAPAGLFPPITLGKDEDFTEYVLPKQTPIYNLDLNNDGTVNSIDLSIVTSSLSQTGPHTADVNNDGVVDQEDFQLVKKATEK